jgi:uncharacterized protein YkwD
MKKLIFLSLLLPVQLFALTSASSSQPHDILLDMNIYRVQHNLSSLTKSEALCDLAKVRVEQIKTDWSHGQFQPELDKISNMNGVFYENLARTFVPEDVVWGWSMSQMGHREAMLVPEMKYGCVVQSGNYYTFEGYVPSN